MPQLSTNNAIENQAVRSAGRWVTDKIYAQENGLNRQTLINWRYRDRLAGRTQAAPGFPVYRRFGTVVRYFLD